MELFKQLAIPTLLAHFLLVAIFALLIGLAQRRKLTSDQEESFGTDRTHTLIGILGFITYHLDTKNLLFFGGGGVLLAFLLGLYYLKKNHAEHRYGLTSILIGLITYCLTPIVILQPYWFSLLLLVVVLVLIEIKPTFVAFTAKIGEDEFTTLAKFILMAGVILPLLPNQPIFSFIDLHPYKVWLSVVIISGISYTSYLLRKFVFKHSGIILTGALGGLYSSTATTVVMAKKSSENPNNALHYSSGILAAITVMYMRVGIFCLLINLQLALYLLPYLAVIIVSCGGLTAFFSYKALQSPLNDTNKDIDEKENPLEIKFAVLSAILFITFSVITHFAVEYYGSSGLQWLSWVAGVADIDPFLLNIFQNTNQLPYVIISIAALQSVVTNNILKTSLALSFATPTIRKTLLMSLGAVIVINLLVVGVLYIVAY